jgi:prefoldin subunit 5
MEETGPRRGLQLFGLALIVYGLVGIGIFVAVAVAVDRPLDRIQRVSESIESQRDALVASLDQAATTIESMATGVTGTNDSLGEVTASIERAAQIATGVSGSMYQLRDSANVTIFGQQPFAGLSGAFDTAGTQLIALSENLAAIEAAVEGNRADVTTISANLSELAESVGALSTEVENGLGVDISPASINNLRLGIYAICGWLVVFGVFCVFGGLYMIRAGGHGGSVA